MHEVVEDFGRNRGNLLAVCLEESETSVCISDDLDLHLYKLEISSLGLVIFYIKVEQV